MKISKRVKIFLVDDDPIYLKSLEIQFLEYEFIAIETYPTGELCIQNLNSNPDLIILDYYLDGIEKNAMNGIDTLDKIKLFNDAIPVIMLSAQDKIDIAINCMHHKATDYVVKSETAFTRLKKIITNYFHLQKVEVELNWYMERM